MYRYNLIFKAASYLCVLILIYPLSPYLFRMWLSCKESNFIPPVSAFRGLAIRADIMGDGHFGARRSGGSRRHKGLDIVGKVGEPVFASKSGIVESGDITKGMGRYVKVFHPDGFTTVYGHLDSIAVEDKAWVWQGEKVGTVGKTGNANYPYMSPHLHFEIRYKDKSQDPLTTISNKRN